ncbi:MAG: hypothetical protein IPM79_37450 [Polyangiaceae bacterium]|nr:hypothetical protein [Polyangiaceae bacterium]
MSRTRSLPPTDDTIQIAIPRSVLTVHETPVTASQRTAERALGIPPAAYLGSLRAYARRW